MLFQKISSATRSKFSYHLKLSYSFPTLLLLQKHKHCRYTAYKKHSKYIWIHKTLCCRSEQTQFKMTSLLCQILLDCGSDFLSPLVGMLMESPSSFLLSSTLHVHLLESLLSMPVLHCLVLLILLVLVPHLLQPDYPNLLLIVDLTDFEFPAPNQEGQIPLSTGSELPFLAEFPEIPVAVVLKDLLVMAFHWDARRSDDLP